jgi:peptide/nickel transport system substrate-binding protein
MALSVDHQAFIDILTLGEGDIGGAMQPSPEGVWGMPPEVLGTLPGYTPDVARNRAQARGIMEKLSYGPDNRLAIKVSARNIAPTRDPAALLIGQLKEIYIGGEIEMVDTTNWYPKVLRKDFTVGMMVSENGLDDPDQSFYENYARHPARASTEPCRSLHSPCVRSRPAFMQPCRSGPIPTALPSPLLCYGGSFDVPRFSRCSGSVDPSLFRSYRSLL